MTDRTKINEAKWPKNVFGAFKDWKRLTYLQKLYIKVSNVVSVFVNAAQIRTSEEDVIRRKRNFRVNLKRYPAHFIERAIAELQHCKPDTIPIYPARLGNGPSWAEVLSRIRIVPSRADSRSETIRSSWNPLPPEGGRGFSSTRAVRAKSKEWIIRNTRMLPYCLEGSCWLPSF